MCADHTGLRHALGRPSRCLNSKVQAVIPSLHKCQCLSAIVMTCMKTCIWSAPPLRCCIGLLCLAGCRQSLTDDGEVTNLLRRW